MKGLGGFHLAVRASSEIAAAALRSRKHREDKPFAVMVHDTGTARQLCQLDERRTTSPGEPPPAHRAPGPPGRRRHRADWAGTGASPRHRHRPSVAPGNRHLGLMLPYTPVHHLLARALGEPFVLTSGNISDEPIAFLDDEARARLERHRRRLPHPRPAHPYPHRRLGHALAARPRHPPAPVPGVRAPTAAPAPGRCAARCWPAAPS